MAIDWDNKEICKEFRLALEAVYLDYDELDRFVAEELGKNLATISEKAILSTVTFRLLKEAKAKGWLDKVFDAFCSENPNHPVIAKLQQRPLIKKSSNLEEEDWTLLFENLSPYKFEDILIAFFRGFRQALNVDFQKVRPGHPLDEKTQIQILLSEYDNPLLAVRFVEFVIAEFQRSSKDKDRDLTRLEQWRDRIAQKHNIPLGIPEISALMNRQGYLLVSLKESGRQTQKDGSFVTIYSELRVTGELTSIEFEATSIACSLNEVDEHVSELIRKAENALISYEISEVTLEIFLPCIYLEENISDWKFRNDQNRPRPLGKERGFLVRSLERAMNQRMRMTLEKKWQLLKGYVANKTVLEKFHCQEVCPELGDLSASLSDKTGLRFLAELPTDREQRIEILYDIINSAVPIALWSTKADSCTVAELRIHFDNLLQESQLTDFANLAQKWRKRRGERDNVAMQHIKLLCDCPDRWPNLPDPNQEDDSLFPP